MKRYERYKDSGVEWLGEVPEHWEVKRLKYLFSFGKGLNITKENLTKSGFPVINYGQIHSKNNTGTYINKLLIKYISNDYIKSNPQSLVVKGDFIFADTSEDVAGVGNCTYIDSKSSLFAGYHTIILRSLIGDNCKYLAYLFLTNKWRSQLRSRVSGIKVLSITKGILSDNTVVFPPLEEQKKIVKFLDERCAKIDKTLEQKEQMIELLNERRQIIIQRAVTRGLNPDTPLKDSDIDWIGQIPSHWKIKRLKYIFNKIQTGTTPPTNIENYFNGDINWFNPSDLNAEILNDSIKKISKLAIQRNEINFFDADSVLVVGIGGTTGKTSFMPDYGTFNQQITGFHSNNQHNKFCYYQIKSYANMFLKIANYTTLPILNNDFFKNFILPLPPFEEQKVIADFLDRINKKTKNAISLKRQEIEQLKEYKQTLINSAVTGKIKIE